MLGEDCQRTATHTHTYIYIYQAEWRPENQVLQQHFLDLVEESRHGKTCKLQQMVDGSSNLLELELER